MPDEVGREALCATAHFRRPFDNPNGVLFFAEAGHRCRLAFLAGRV
jgi:hypothetical protein